MGAPDAFASLESGMVEPGVWVSLTPPIFGTNPTMGPIPICEQVSDILSGLQRKPEAV